MSRKVNEAWLVGLGIVLMLGLAGVAEAQDSDGDGVLDVDDLCPGTEPNTAVDSSGCSMVLAYTHFVFDVAPSAASIAVDANGDILIASYSTGDTVPIPVNKYKRLTGKHLGKFDVTVAKDPGAPLDHIHPYALDVDPAGNIVMGSSDGLKQTLTTITADGTAVSQFDVTGVGEWPSDIRTLSNGGCDPDGNFWWLGHYLHEPPDEPNYWVLHSTLLDNDPCTGGIQIMRIENNDHPPIDYGWTLMGVDFDDNGLLYVADFCRIWRFDPCDIANTAVVIAGNPDNSAGSGPGEFYNGIHGLAVVGDRIYAANSADPNELSVQIFKASTGQFIQKVTHPTLDSIYDIDVDAEGNIYVNSPGAETSEDVHLWAPPFCGDPLHLPPTADVNKDCSVDREDVIDMAELWLLCTHPDGTGCQDLIQAELMYMPYCGETAMTVDGLVGDWPVDPCWVDLDLIYTGEPCDITSAKYAVCWDPCDDLFYALINVVDTDHVFETAPTDWHTSDRVEIYVQADPNGGGNWGSADDATYDKAQQYIVGYQGLLDWTWAVFGHGTYLPGDFEPFNAHFADAGRISGDTITYEISAKAWQWYGGITPAVDPNVVRQLEPGLHVGFDIVADSRRGTPPHDDGEFGMLSANPDKDKYQRAEQFQRWALLDYDGSIVPPGCGDWGYYPADVSGDCYVNLSDMLLMYSTWLDCTDPTCQ